MDSQQELENQDEVNKLRLEKAELKKELEREQLLHNMLYKEWKELQEKVKAREQEIYYESKPKNLFYKYAFFVLLLALVPAIYFLYPFTGAKRIVSSSPAAIDSAKDSLSGTAALNDSPNAKDSVVIVKEKPLVTRAEVKQSSSAKTIIAPAPKSTALNDSSLLKRSIARKRTVIEKPLTDDIRDSISSEGFSAYFDHRRNPFRPSSERFKIWQKGWNSGKIEAEKVVAKDPSLKDK